MYKEVFGVRAVVCGVLCPSSPLLIGMPTQSVRDEWELGDNDRGDAAGRQHDKKKREKESTTGDKWVLRK